jgi:hypothetical protein
VIGGVRLAPDMSEIEAQSAGQQGSVFRKEPRVTRSVQGSDKWSLQHVFVVSELLCSVEAVCALSLSRQQVAVVSSCCPAGPTMSSGSDHLALSTFLQIRTNIKHSHAGPAAGSLPGVISL